MISNIDAAILKEGGKIAGGMYLFWDDVSRLDLCSPLSAEIGEEHELRSRVTILERMNHRHFTPPVGKDRR